jgi:hypothetical protein
VREVKKKVLLLTTVAILALLTPSTITILPVPSARAAFLFES